MSKVNPGSSFPAAAGSCSGWREHEWKIAQFQERKGCGGFWSRTSWYNNSVQVEPENSSFTTLLSSKIILLFQEYKRTILRFSNIGLMIVPKHRKLSFFSAVQQRWDDIND